MGLLASTGLSTAKAVVSAIQVKTITAIHVEFQLRDFNHTGNTRESFFHIGTIFCTSLEFPFEAMNVAVPMLELGVVKQHDRQCLSCSQSVSKGNPPTNQVVKMIALRNLPASVLFDQKE
jgi:hypothetical protein